MMSTTLVQTALAALLTVLFIVGEPSAPVVTLIAFGSGIAAALGFPAYQAMLPDLVPVEDLPGAIALSSAQYNLGRVVGPAIAGVVIDARRLRVGAGHQRGQLPRRRRGRPDTLPLPPPTPPPEGETLWRSIGERFRFVPPRARAAGQRRRDVPQHVPRRAVHRARSRDGREGVRRGHTRHVGPRHRAGHRRRRDGRSRSARSTTRSGCAGVVVAMIVLLPPALAVVRVRAACSRSRRWRSSSSARSTSARCRASRRSRSCARRADCGAACSPVNNVILGSLYPLGAVVQGKIADRIGLRATTVGAAVLMAARAARGAPRPTGLSTAARRAPRPIVDDVAAR